MEREIKINLGHFVTVRYGELRLMLKKSVRTSTKLGLKPNLKQLKTEERSELNEYCM
jgi:hypothetical protein